MTARNDEVIEFVGEDAGDSIGLNFDRGEMYVGFIEAPDEERHRPVANVGAVRFSRETAVAIAAEILRAFSPVEGGAE